MIRAFTSGMSGSSFPARTRVGCRMSGRAGRLVQPTPARSCRSVPGPGAEALASWTHVPGLVGVPPHQAAVQLRCDGLRVGRVPVAPGGQHLEEDAGSGRHHQHPGAGADQHHVVGSDVGSGRPAVGPGRRPRRCPGRRTGRGRAGRPASRRGTPASRRCTAPWGRMTLRRRGRRTGRPRSGGRPRRRRAGAGPGWRRCRCTGSGVGRALYPAGPQLGCHGRGRGPAGRWSRVQHVGAGCVRQHAQSG